MVPLSESSKGLEDRSIVFIGHIDVGNYFASAECQSMWVIAYLDQKLSLLIAEEQKKDVALFVSWCRRRYLSNGQEGVNMDFKSIGYCDMLLKDLGLSSNRKGWFRDLFAPAWAKDFAGLSTEFRLKFGQA
jgi:hypothetical protein